MLQRELRDFADRGFGACAIEASSIGIAERRLDGTRIAVAVFTNFTQDHLDYHGSMDAYWQAKAELFRWPGLRAAVVNIDDVHGASAGRRTWSSAASARSTSGPSRPPARRRGCRPATSATTRRACSFTVVEQGVPRRARWRPR